MSSWRYLLWTVLFLGCLSGIAVVIAPQIGLIFQANVWLNSFIGCVFVVSVVYGLVPLFQLARSLQKLALWKSQEWEDQDHEVGVPKLLNPFLDLLKRKQFVSSETKVLIQDFYSVIFGNTHAGLRYAMGSLVFLGLLGTFWGLSLTIQSISHVITHLPTESVGGSEFFTLLKDSLQSPLAGMGTAFGTSLFGISGSIILGFLDLQLSKASHVFIAEIESFVDQNRAGNDVSEKSFSRPYMEALCEHLCEQIDKLQRVVQQAEKNKETLSEVLFELSNKMGRLADQMHMEQPVLLKLAENQVNVERALQTLVNDIQGHSLRESITWQTEQLDERLSHLTNSLRAGQDDATEVVRRELRLLGRSVSNALSVDPEK